MNYELNQSQVDLLRQFGLLPSKTVDDQPKTEPKIEEQTEIIPDEDDVEEMSEEDEKVLREAQEAKEREIEYNMYLQDRYPPESPYHKFKHQFNRAGYLPCKIVHYNEAEPTEEEVLEEMMNNAVTPKGKTDQVEFCKVWHDMYRYEYAGLIYTPHGAITVEMFKHEITKMVFAMGIETVNVDVVVKHICDAYIHMYMGDPEMDVNLIPFRNGDLYLDKDKKGYTFYEGRHASVLYRFDYDFVNVPNTSVEPEFPNFKKWRDDLFDDDDRYTLKQILGYLMQPSNDAQEAFFIVGQAGTGKSVLTNYIIPALLGNASVMIQVTELFSDKFQTSAAQGKLCVFDDDIGEATFSKEETGNFKSFISGNKIKVERKYADPINIRNTAKLVCCGNHLINSDDKTEGFTRRIHPVYIKPRVIEKVDVRLGQKIQSEIQMIALWALEGLLELYSTQDLKPYWSDRTSFRMIDYIDMQKWEELFIEDNFVFGEGEFTYTETIKEALTEWMKENRDISYDFRKNWRAVKKWLTEEGCDKFHFEYKRGVKRGDKYNATGYLNMAVRKAVTEPTLYTDEHGRTILRISKKRMDEIRAERKNRK